MKRICWIHVILGLFLALMPLACSSDDRIEVIEACGGQSLNDLKTTNTISDECREALEGLLPDDKSNLAGKTVAIGNGKIDGDRVLLIVGTNSYSQPIDIVNADVEVTADGELIPEWGYTVKRAASLDGMVISFACALDYSGSMLDSDIDDAIDVFEALFSIPVEFEADYRIFSDTVLQKIDFSNDNVSLQNALRRDNAFDRASTALFDAMGDGINALGRRNGPAKLLIVGTDGHENASQTYTTEDQIFKMAEQRDVHIIVAGSLLSDLSFMKRAAKETDGFYFYSNYFNSLKDMTDELVSALSEMGAIVITDDEHSDADRYEVRVNGKGIKY